jgi:hypothetical protein
MGVRRKFLEWWPNLFGGLLLVLGVFGYIRGSIPYISGLTDFYLDIKSVLVGIGITVLIIDNANKMLATRKEKERLLLQMGSPDHAFSIEAVRIIRAKNWHKDGTLINADLFNANLSMANLSGAILINARLTIADLKGADLREADLSGTDLEDALLESAVLWDTILTNGNLWGADLSGADLKDALLLDVNLTNAIISDSQLAQAISLKGATMPDGTIYDGRFEKADE